MTPAEQAAYDLGRADGEKAARELAVEEFQGIITALRYYANQHHFLIADENSWDTVSGEPQNFHCDEAGTATVEDGTIAKLALRGEVIHWIEDGEDCSPKPIEGEAISLLSPAADRVLVPMEPTDEMIQAALDCQDAAPEDDSRTEMYYAYKAMLSASERVAVK